MQTLLFSVSNYVVTMVSKLGLLGATIDDTDAPEWVKNVINPLLEILDALLVPILIIIGTAGSIYAIVLAVNFSRAETADKREEAKKRMINAIVGLVVMVLLLVILQLFVSYAPDIATWISTSFGTNS